MARNQPSESGSTGVATDNPTTPVSIALRVVTLLDLVGRNEGGSACATPSGRQASTGRR